ncbi:uncharacterized protein LOC133303865 [Gastrolobium bilobum]|uniref:uncharacterized protein LOC133303865 n=1 Tax=Gastrolobium bilobum TaxID=150636 RepID=UPI002AB1D2D2|nr:uncharacterized protein LOC133303865 [Gastrolobium bilobum]
MVSSISQGLVLTTAMLVSSTVLYLAFSRQKIHGGNPDSHDDDSSNKQILRSCLYSEEKKRERKMMKKKKKKKKVQFADNVKEAIETSELGMKEQRKQNRVSSNCRHQTPEIRRIPENRIALYNGILRDRVHRMECSY